MTMRSLSITVGLLAFLFASTEAMAFRFAPIEAVMAPSGGKASHNFQITNIESEPIAIDIRIVSRSTDQTGIERHIPADDQFIVYPAQAIVTPGQTQTVRVQWVGDPAPGKEIPFRLIAEQLPIDLGPTPTDGAQVRLLVRYVASLYVRPGGTSPNPVVNNFRRVDDPAIGDSIRLDISNQGTQHVLLKDVLLTAVSKEDRLELSLDDLGEAATINLLPGELRHILLPWPKALNTELDSVEAQARAQ